MKEFCFISLPVVLTIVLVSAADLSPECQYVSTNFLLKDVEQVKKCWNNYTIDDKFKVTVLEHLRYIRDVYPYVEIAKNPPSNPPGYFKIMDYDAELKKLETKFSQPDANIISNFYHYTFGFVHSFRDGHFRMVSVSREYPNIFFFSCRCSSFQS